MTGGRIKRIEKYLGDDQEFLLTYGDGVGTVDITALASAAGGTLIINSIPITINPGDNAATILAAITGAGADIGLILGGVGIPRGLMLGPRVVVEPTVAGVVEVARVVGRITLVDRERPLPVTYQAGLEDLVRPLGHRGQGPAHVGVTPEA